MKPIKFRTSLIHLPDSIDQMVFRILDDFKDGVTDGLIHGIRSETNKAHYYKEGYDFGLVLHSDQIDVFNKHKYGEKEQNETLK